MLENRLWILLAKKLKQELSKAEAEELSALLLTHKHDVHLQEWLTHPDALQIQSTQEETISRENSWNTLAEMLNKESPQPAPLYEGSAKPLARWTPLYRKSIILMAASMTGIVIIAALFFRNKPGQQSFPPASGEFVQVIGSKMTKTSFVLPDGSTVLLNRSGKLAYNKDYGEKAREIRLSGEAYFDIKKNKDIPLIVHAGNMDIKVLGTVFNVRTSLDDSVVETLLVSGAIEVNAVEAPGEKVLLHPGEKMVMGLSGKKDPGINGESPVSGSRNSFRKMMPALLSPTDSTAIETEWIGDTMSFHGQSFEQLAERMERWYNIEINIRDNTLKKKQFTGSFEKENLEEALKALTGITPFHYRIVNGLVIIER